MSAVPSESRLPLRLGMFLIIGVLGCMRVIHYTYLAPQHYAPRPDTAYVAVFYLPDFTVGGPIPLSRPYELLARFEVAAGISTGSVEERARKEARKVGGDAIVVQFVGGALDARTELSNVYVLKYK